MHDHGRQRLQLSMAGHGLDPITTFAIHFANHDTQASVHFLGHAIGLSLHEEFFTAGPTKVVFEPGMTLSFEPLHAEADGATYDTEGKLELTADGIQDVTALLGHELIMAGESHP